MDRCRVSEDLEAYLSKEENTGSMEDYIEEHLEEAMLKKYESAILLEALEDDVEGISNKFNELLVMRIQGRQIPEGAYMELGKTLFEMVYKRLEESVRVDLEYAGG